MKAVFPPCRRSSPPGHPGDAGFTLIEICLALGIIAFAVLPLVGLLSIGLDSYRNAVFRMRATQALNQIATSLRRAAAVTNTTGALTGQYVALPPLPQPSATPNPDLPGVTVIPVEWTPAATAIPQTYTLYFDENGTFISDASPAVASGVAPPAGARLAAAIVVTPPTTKYDAGSAQITVGWPATPTSGPFYTAPSFSYGTIQGHVDNIITLSPLPGQ